MILIPEDKIRKILATNEWVLTASTARTYINDDTQAGPYLRFYIMLTEAPESFTAEGFSAEQIFYSRYYWFCRYSRVKQAIAGADMSLEQQGFKMLEHPYPKCKPDWSAVERSKLLAEQDALADLKK